jgi:NAD(P)-dependent dehydrogenase (short-subunit alcohol dehydrogenase family)
VAGSRLGAATARRFSDEGARVVVADINAAAAEELAASLADAPAVTVDTSEPTSVGLAIATAVSRYGRIDVIFNNAGYTYPRDHVHVQRPQDRRAIAGARFERHSDIGTSGRRRGRRRRLPTGPTPAGLRRRWS